MGEEVQARRLGRKLSRSISSPEPVTIPVEDGENITGIAWFPGEAGILFVHDRQADASADSWGTWPDRFAQLGYAVLAVDMPEHASPRQIEAAGGFLRSKGASRLFIIAAGESVEELDAAMADGFVLIAPSGELLDPVALGVTPKLIVAGSAVDTEFSVVEQFARACRGWSVLSTFVTENTMAALLEGRHALQIGSQIAEFLQEYRTATPPQTAATARQAPKRH